MNTFIKNIRLKIYIFKNIKILHIVQLNSYFNKRSLLKLLDKYV